MSTKYKIEITSSMAEDVKYFEYLRMKIVDEGLLISAKSESFGKFFTARAQKTTTGKASYYQGVGIWSNGKFLNIANPLPQEVLGYLNPTEGSLFRDGTPNLQWWTHVDLEKGFDLLVPVAISLNNFEDYFSGCCTAIQTFHQTSLRHGELEATFSFREEEG